MSQDIVPTASDPARAFEDLRGEVSLLRRAVQGLTAERQNAPDYLPTLQQMVERLDWIARKVERVATAPAMELMVESLASRVEQASVEARLETRQLVADANAVMRASIARIDAVVERGWTAERQWRHLLWTAAIAFALGLLLCAIIPRIFEYHPSHPREAAAFGRKQWARIRSSFPCPTSSL
ncbi:MAG TPA: DUF6118 family protein [Allosphingosinicella sp.]|jgi:hypothetical protein|nr:DUF6118 family protein [Allosphingosinicella sp.]